ncbi:MAG: ArgR family transcriptional regulator [Mobiluncus porci]|uniref:Arginine repressor n=1 Tax=Mobiluncus porci TaxID=2652278 RepID=A0A7K0K3P2_9ACTO|nr:MULTISPECIES: ArgR family transcriptional regulator [Mobiluncus]MCI6585077.1 ArgR family transcriptional regulator [Mobiluncus sp.]MDD7542083.1 ArgR family transcriptional regulator [Mobiluncus porci]MDY5749426.1 ArgR family transcriptional regulator [Mobiluncus porci]MST50107.1 ArgR family transcriptional regulator [Mobiluncus porci]
MSDTITRGMSSKVSRHAAIARLLKEKPVRSQGSLQILLESAGFNVTQATLSRDLEELGAMKVRDPDGGQRYALGASLDSEEIPLTLPGSLERWISQLLIEARAALNQVVLRTPSAVASALAAAIDKEDLDGVLGCIAGDDTVLIICADETRANQLCAEIQQMTHQ